MIKAAYLRVYVPRDLTSLRTSAAHGRHRSVVRADGHFVWAESDADDAFQVQWDGRTLVCPRHGRLRMLEGILAFDNAHPGAPLLPRAVVQRAAAELATMKSGSPRPRSFILTSPWHVPLRWFSAFDAAERELYDLDDDVSLRYRADLQTAVERVDRSTDILDRAGFDDSIIEQVRDLHRWLADFPPASMVELDYSSVAELFSAAELAFDDSAAQVRSSLDALDELDYETAGELYSAVAGRWAPVQALTYVN